MVSNRVTKTKTYLANATLHLRKWAMNDSLVQNVIDNKENKSERTRSGKIRHDNETYAQTDSAAVQNTLKDLPLIRIPIQLVFFFLESQTLLERQTGCKLPNVDLKICNVFLLTGCCVSDSVGSKSFIPRNM